MSNNLVVRFAGEGGQGQVTAAEGLAQAAARVGYHVRTYATFPSQIKGGPVFAQASISVDEILSSGDELDVLVALNRWQYDHQIDDLREGGIVVYNSEEFELDEHPLVIGVAADAMARSTGNVLAVNFVLIGVVGAIVGMPVDYFEEYNRARYTRGRPNDQAIIDGNNMALRLGYEAAEASKIKLDPLGSPEQQDGERVLVSGFESRSMGAIAAGLDTFIGYPISPATTMLVFMENNLTGDGKTVVQASSEIETINALVGAGFAGKKAMTSTAGPGLSLMGEGLGLAWMAEIPLVVVDVQRGGPATGLPTKVEQSDLLSAINPGHGDMSLPVIAPGSIAECFWASIHALNWAERYQGPVILLSDHEQSDSYTDIERPDLSHLGVEERTVSQGEQGNRRYEGDGMSPFPVPGGAGAYIANASEHDEQGDTTHLPEVHIRMTERRFKKLDLLRDGDYERDNASASVALMPWGGTKGPTLAAYRRLREQDEALAWYFTMFVNPLPTDLLEELRRKELVIVPELNYLGQLSGVLRSLGVNAKSITQYTGQPFKASALVEAVRAEIATTSGRLAAV